MHSSEPFFLYPLRQCQPWGALYRSNEYVSGATLIPFDKHEHKQLQQRAARLRPRAGNPVPFSPTTKSAKLLSCFRYSMQKSCCREAGERPATMGVLCYQDTDDLLETASLHRGLRHPLQRAHLVEQIFEKIRIGLDPAGEPFSSQDRTCTSLGLTRETLHDSLSHRLKVVCHVLVRVSSESDKLGLVANVACEFDYGFAKSKLTPNEGVAGQVRLLIAGCALEY